MAQCFSYQCDAVAQRPRRSSTACHPYSLQPQLLLDLHPGLVRLIHLFATGKHEWSFMTVPRGALYIFANTR